MMEVRKNEGGKDEAKKKSTDYIYQPKYIALGILKHFQLNSQSKNKSKY